MLVVARVVAPRTIEVPLLLTSVGDGDMSYDMKIPMLVLLMHFLASYKVMLVRHMSDTLIITCQLKFYACIAFMSHTKNIFYVTDMIMICKAHKFYQVTTIIRTCC